MEDTGKEDSSWEADEGAAFKLLQPVKIEALASAPGDDAPGSAHAGAPHAALPPLPPASRARPPAGARAPATPLHGSANGSNASAASWAGARTPPAGGARDDSSLHSPLEHSGTQHAGYGPGWQHHASLTAAHRNSSFASVGSHWSSRSVASSSLQSVDVSVIQPVRADEEDEGAEGDVSGPRSVCGHTTAAGWAEGHTAATYRTHCSDGEQESKCHSLDEEDDEEDEDEEGKQEEAVGLQQEAAPSSSLLEPLQADIEAAVAGLCEPLSASTVAGLFGNALQQHQEQAVEAAGLPQQLVEEDKDESVVITVPACSSSSASDAAFPAPASSSSASFASWSGSEASVLLLPERAGHTGPMRKGKVATQASDAAAIVAAEPAPAAAEAAPTSAPAAPSWGPWRSVSTADGLTYFYHRETRETTWELPADVDPLTVKPAGKVYQPAAGGDTTATSQLAASSQQGTPDAATRARAYRYAVGGGLAATPSAASFTLASSRLEDVDATAASFAGRHAGRGMDSILEEVQEEEKEGSHSSVAADGLLPCSFCSRRFVASSLGVHEAACRSVFGTKRAAFSSQARRLAGSPAEALTYASRRIPPCARCHRAFSVASDAAEHALLCKGAVHAHAAPSAAAAALSPASKATAPHPGVEAHLALLKSKAPASEPRSTRRRAAAAAAAAAAAGASPMPALVAATPAHAGRPAAAVASPPSDTLSSPAVRCIRFDTTDVEATANDEQRLEAFARQLAQVEDSMLQQQQQQQQSCGQGSSQVGAALPEEDEGSAGEEAGLDPLAASIAAEAPVSCGSCGVTLRGAAALCAHLAAECTVWKAAAKPHAKAAPAAPAIAAAPLPVSAAVEAEGSDEEDEDDAPADFEAVTAALAAAAPAPAVPPSAAAFEDDSIAVAFSSTVPSAAHVTTAAAAVPAPQQRAADKTPAPAAVPSFGAAAAAGSSPAPTTLHHASPAPGSLPSRLPVARSRLVASKVSLAAAVAPPVPTPAPATAAAPASALRLLKGRLAAGSAPGASPAGTASAVKARHPLAGAVTTARAPGASPAEAADTPILGTVSPAEVVQQAAVAGASPSKVLHCPMCGSAHASERLWVHLGTCNGAVATAGAAGASPAAAAPAPHKPADASVDYTAGIGVTHTTLAGLDPLQRSIVRAQTVARALFHSPLAASAARKRQAAGVDGSGFVSGALYEGDSVSGLAQSPLPWRYRGAAGGGAEAHLPPPSMEALVEISL